jgi:hypothetical protein
MTRLPLRIAVVSSLVVGVIFAIFFGRVNRPATADSFPKGTTCTGCGLERLPIPIAVAKVPISRGTSALGIGSKSLRWKSIPRSEFAAGMLSNPQEVPGEITIRAIPAGATLTDADFGLRGPIFYPSGYPKSVPASQVPAKFVKSNYLPADTYPSDLEVAPGVFVDGKPPAATTDLHVANGMLIGYCAQVRNFESHNPDVPFTSKCWHYQR